MSRFFQDTDSTPASPLSRGDGMGGRWWLIAVTAALLAYSWTGTPLLPALGLSIPFGKDDWQTGFWLWRTDPCPARGHACAWLSIAKSATRIVLATLGMLVLFNALASLTPRQNPFPEAPIPLGQQALLTLAQIAIPVVVVLTLAGMLVARRNRVSVWLDPALHATRKSGDWPPAQFGPTNHAQTPWLSAVSVSLIVLVIAVIIVFFPTSGAVARHHEIVPALCAITICVMILGTLIRTARHTLAKSPENCWSEGSPAIPAVPTTTRTQTCEAAE